MEAPHGKIAGELLTVVAVMAVVALLRLVVLPLPDGSAPAPSSNGLTGRPVPHPTDTQVSTLSHLHTSDRVLPTPLTIWQSGRCSCGPAHPRWIFVWRHTDEGRGATRLEGRGREIHPDASTSPRRRSRMGTRSASSTSIRSRACRSGQTGARRTAFVSDAKPRAVAQIVEAGRGPRPGPDADRYAAPTRPMRWKPP